MLTQTIKKCSVCHREFPVGASFCPHDGASLVEVPTPNPELRPEATEPYRSNAGTPAEPPTDPLVGRILERRYKIVEPIGHGGMGTVYRALHTELNRSFAIKLIRNELGADEVALRRFKREALALGAISHPNAVAVTDFGVTDDGIAFLIMEFLQGRTLRSVVSSRTRIALPRTVSILSQICAAVTAAHRVGIIHRDLKPENIMLVETDEGERIKVLDFGIARLRSGESITGRLTAQDLIIGTPRYMSPEACKGLEQTTASDIYALGVILYEMLTGRAPFETSAEVSPLELALKHVETAPPPPSTFNPELTPAIDAVVVKALAKDPEARYESAAELSKAFDAAVSDLLASAPTTNPLPSAVGDVDTDGGSASARQTKFEGSRPTVPDIPVRTPVAEPEPSRFPVGLVAAAAGIVLVVGAILVAVAWSQGWFAATPAPGPTPPPVPIGKATPTVTQAPPGMVVVPGGDFDMGEPEDAVARDPRDPPDSPPHRVHVESFYIDVHEVTNGEYEKFVKAKNAPRPSTWDATNRPADWKDLPVTGVSWVDAAAYAEWSGKRLPTEEEWEWAARGPDGRKYPWGNTLDDSRTQTGERASDRPEPVGSRPNGASPFGVLDMAGSVWEWTSSNYVPYPGGPDVPKEMLDAKVIRGGSYTSDAVTQRSTNRAVQTPYTRDPRIGFRCAKSIGE